MPLDSRMVGQRSEAVTHDIDARWTMAYAAGLGDTLPGYFDTAANDPVLAHPLFPVCLEWQVRIDGRTGNLPWLSRLGVAGCLLLSEENGVRRHLTRLS